MKNFDREDQWFSLCGLNCGLCTMRLGGYCPGCGGGEGNQSCKIAKCSMEHEGVQYCFQCSCYPCETYEKMDGSEVVITSRNRFQDIKRFREIGAQSYAREQRDRAAYLQILLEHYNDGRRKTFYSLAVNLFQLEDLVSVMKHIEENVREDAPVKERAAEAVRLFQSVADSRGIVLKLNKRK